MNSILFIIFAIIFIYYLFVALKGMNETDDRKKTILVVITYVLVLSLFLFFSIETIIRVPFLSLQFILTFTLIILSSLGIGLLVKKIIINNFDNNKKVKSNLNRVFIYGILISVVAVRYIYS